MSQQQFLSPNNARYRNARSSLAVIVFASLLNLVLYFANVYLLFSAYTPLLIVSIGDLLAAETELSAFVYIFAAFALITIIPYLLCWIFSKKKVGWMIAALVLFSLDSLIFLYNFVLLLMSGDFTMVIDLIIRIWAISSLISGVIYGCKMKKEPQEDAVPAINEETAFGTPASDTFRQLTVSRKKSFYGSAMKITVYVNRKAVGQLKNGQTQTFSVPTSQFELVAAMSTPVTGKVTVPYGESNIHYQMSLKAHASYTEIKLEPSNNR